MAIIEEKLNKTAPMKLLSLTKQLAHLSMGSLQVVELM